MVEILPCVEIEPSASPHIGSVIWMHGLGANGHDFEPVVPMLRLPAARFVFPHAPAIPVTVNGGVVMPAWYDIRHLEPRPDREDPAGIRRSAGLIEALINREIERGVAPERIVLAGFSQGAAMALHVGVRYAKPLAGIMVLSGYRLLPEVFEAERSEANRPTPMLFCHGSQDPLVPMAQGKEAYTFIKEPSVADDVRWHEFPIGHEVSVPEIEVIAAWLAERLG